MAGWTLDGEPPFSVEDAWIEGWDFTVVFDSALVGGLDEELDELLANLAGAGGITEVIHEDRRCSTSRSTTSTLSRSRGRSPRRWSGPVSATTRAHPQRSVLAAVLYGVESLGYRNLER
jgi:hypothetical protein